MSHAIVQNCLFCQLAAVPVPHEIYRDDAIYAILVLHPIRPGHALILPRDHYPYFDDMPADLNARIVEFGQRLARVQKAAFGVERVGFLYTGGDVPHAHAHVVPLHEKSDITSTRYIREKDLTFEEAPKAGRHELRDIAAVMRSALEHLS